MQLVWLDLFISVSAVEEDTQEGDCVLEGRGHHRTATRGNETKPNSKVADP